MSLLLWLLIYEILNFWELNNNIASDKISELLLVKHTFKHLHWQLGFFTIGFLLLSYDRLAQIFPCFSCGNVLTHEVQCSLFWQCPFMGWGQYGVRSGNIFCLFFSFSFFFCENLFMRIMHNCILLICHFWKELKSFLQCPPALREHESLTSHDGAASALTAEFLIDWGLDVSTPDTFRPPPAPLPYDLVLGCTQSTYSESGRETISSCSFGTLTTCEDLVESDCKAQANSLSVSPRKLEIPNLNEPNVSVAEEEDDCPICLEGALWGNWCFHSL